MGFWDCEKCGTKSIMDLPVCPQCRAERPADGVPAAPESPSEPESAAAGLADEPQALTGRKTGNAKSKP